MSKAIAAMTLDASVSVLIITLGIGMLEITPWAWVQIGAGIFRLTWRPLLVWRDWLPTKEAR